MILLNEDRCADLYGLTGWCVYCEGAAADVGRLFENGDVERDGGRASILLKMVRC